MAESVNRGNCGTVEVHDGAIEPVQSLRPRSIGVHAFRQLFKSWQIALVVYRISSFRKIRPEKSQYLANAVAQFLCRRLGECHHLDFVNAKAFLRHETGADVLDVVRLSRSGGSGDEVWTLKRKVLLENGCTENRVHLSAFPFRAMEDL